MSPKKWSFILRRSCKVSTHSPCLWVFSGIPVNIKSSRIDLLLRSVKDWVFGFFFLLEPLILDESLLSSCSFVPFTCCRSCEIPVSTLSNISLIAFALVSTSVTVFFMLCIKISKVFTFEKFPVELFRFVISFTIFCSLFSSKLLFSSIFVSLVSTRKSVSWIVPNKISADCLC